MSEAVAAAPVTPVVEVPKPAAAPVPPVNDFAERMKREQAKRESEGLRAKAKEADTLKGRLDGLKADPSKLAEIYGPNWYDYLTEHKIGGGRLTPEAVQAAVDAKFAEREAKEAAAREADQTAEAAAKAEADNEFAQEVTSFVAADPKAYRLINLHGTAQMVANYARDNYKATGKLASNAEAAAAVEAQLRKAVLDSLDPDMVAEWTKGRSDSPSAAPNASNSSTLHNGMSAGSGTPQVKLSRDQRKEAMLKRWDAEVGKGG